MRRSKKKWISCVLVLVFELRWTSRRVSPPKLGGGCASKKISSSLAAQTGGPSDHFEKCIPKHFAWNHPVCSIKGSSDIFDVAATLLT